MYPPHLTYLNEKGTTWFNPAYGITHFLGNYKKLMNIKEAKEIYVSSIIAMAMSKQEQTEQWWVIKPKKDPPDGVIGTIVEKNGLPEMRVREIEVVEHTGGDILDTIRKKLSKKQYEPNTILACYLLRGGVFDLEVLSKIISREATSLSHIFLAFPGRKLSDIHESATQNDFLRSILKITLVQIKPVYSFSSIDPIEDCKNWKEGKEGSFFIFEGKGKGGSRPISLENSPKLYDENL